MIEPFTIHTHVYVHTLNECLQNDGLWLVLLCEDLGPGLIGLRFNGLEVRVGVAQLEPLQVSFTGCLCDRRRNLLKLYVHCIMMRKERYICMHQGSKDFISRDGPDTSFHY